MTGIVHSPEGKHFSSLTRKLIGDKESEYASKRGPRRLHKKERLFVRRYSMFFTNQTGRAVKDRQ